MNRKITDKARKELGAQGESIACSLLEKHGMKVLERNFRGGHKEIDIIATDGVNLHFVEVKTRREPVEGEAWESVNAVKQKNIAVAAKKYLSSEKFRKLGKQFDESLFDIVTVVWNEEGTDYVAEYIPNAYYLIYA